ncbi:hypothetical protein [Lyngbya aestuarii]|uniref:hypothetical protein n=1 Tax=Lyngbya aestuarii TaxID=118322 RepID=UPI00403D9AB8
MSQTQLASYLSYSNDKEEGSSFLFLWSLTRFLGCMESSKNALSSLNYQEIYPCPVCRAGKIQAMPLMEAMACECNRYIFTADLEGQLLKMPDRQPPLLWRWNGKSWVGAHPEGFEWGWVGWLLASGFVALPTTLIGLAAYTFPPDPGSSLSWLPGVWVGLTFLSHLVIVLWLLMEFYQFPLWTYLRIRRQQLLGR